MMLENRFPSFLELQDFFLICEKKIHRNNKHITPPPKKRSAEKKISSVGILAYSKSTNFTISMVYQAFASMDIYPKTNSENQNLTAMSQVTGITTLKSEI